MTEPTSFHGAFKQPGGKLVQVDFTIRDGYLRDVVVSGDFFLEPEEALEPIRASVEGSPVALSEDDRAALIAASIGPGVEWLGASPSGLATAIARALNADG